ncbi:MAG: hypothetical protein WKF59_05250 [Chitinophagaceae bacterium]
MLCIFTVMPNAVNWNDPLYFYGSDTSRIRERMNGTANQWISNDLKIHKMQVEWAVAI